MSAAIAFLVLGIGQAIIYVVLRVFLARAVLGTPSPLLRAVVALVGVVALALLGAAAYFALIGGTA